MNHITLEEYIENETEYINKYKELEEYISKVKYQKVMIPSKKQQYIEEFTKKISGKILTHYYTSENKWILSPTEFLTRISLNYIGVLKKIEGIEMNLLDSTIFIPLTEKNFLNLGKKYYNYTNSPKYLNLEKGLFLEIPNKNDKKYHFLEYKNP